MLPPIRRIVTTHDTDGLAVVQSDVRLPSHEVADGYEATEIWCTNALPARNDDAADGRPGEPGSRALIRFGELAPGHESPMHRSRSLDYGILLEGACELRLDGGETVQLSAGDVVVQRGTNHAWANTSSQPARFVWILVDAEPVTVGGRELPEAMPTGHDVMSDWRTQD